MQYLFGSPNKALTQKPYQTQKQEVHCHQGPRTQIIGVFGPKYYNTIT